MTTKPVKKGSTSPKAGKAKLAAEVPIIRPNLIEYSVESFLYVEPEEPVIAAAAIAIQAKPSLRFDEATSQFWVRLEIEAGNGEGEERNVYVDLVIVFKFHLSGADQIPRAEDGRLNIPEDLARGLTAVAYSTARGVLLERNRGTRLASLSLPILHYGAFVPNGESGHEGDFRPV